MTLTKHTPRKHLLFDGVFLCIFLAAASFLFWKCKFGYGNIDEAFYLTVPYRLFLGDSLFLHEWHLSQMAGVLTLPFVSAYLTLNGNTEGIILAMRYFTTFLQCLVGLLVYYRFRKYNWVGASAAAICCTLYTPFGIMALSYNAMGILFLILFCLCHLPCQIIEKPIWVLSGLFFAGAVLCCPYLVVVFALYFIALILIGIRGKAQNRTFSDVDPIQRALWTLLGTVIAAAAFAVFVLSRASLTEILQAFPHILNDPEHPPVPITSKIKSYIEEIVFATTNSRYLYYFIAVLFGICIFDKERKEHRLIYYIAVYFCIIPLMISHYRQLMYINMMLWTINILGVFIVLLSDEPINRKLFVLFWVTGILYSLCLHLSSNQKYYAITSASSVATVGSVMMVTVFTRELVQTQKSRLHKLLLASLLVVLIGIQLFTLTDLRHRYIFWSTEIDTQTEYLDYGIQDGIYASESSAAFYKQKTEDLKALEKYNSDRTLYLSEETWYYLTDDAGMSCYSAWLAGVNEHTISRLEAYYRLNADKIPDLVYLDQEYESMATLFADTFGYQVFSDAGGWVLIR